MKEYELTRSDTKKLQRDSGALAERLVSEQYQNFARFGVENFDVQNDESGSLGEVKSTAEMIQSGEKGRFWLSKIQHEKLLRADRAGSAYYVFVLWDTSTSRPSARMVRKKPADVGYMVGSAGGWNSSGHHMGPHKKLYWDTVL